MKRMKKRENWEKARDALHECKRREAEREAHVAQLAEHVLGKDEVTRSIRVVGSTPCWIRSWRQDFCPDRWALARSVRKACDAGNAVQNHGSDITKGVGDGEGEI